MAYSFMLKKLLYTRRRRTQRAVLEQQPAPPASYYEQHSVFSTCRQTCFSSAHSAMAVPLSILICTHNRVRHLMATLRTVSQLDIPPTVDPELIIVDNASTDATAAQVSSLSLPNLPHRVVREPRPGAGYARNTALREARGDVLLFTDDDVRLPRDWIARLAAPILDGRADAVAGTVTLAPHLIRPWMQPFHRTALASTESIDEAHPTDIISANMAIARHTLSKVPGFDVELGPGARLGALEDTLFSWQLRQAGFRIVAAPGAAIEHHFDPQRLTREAFVDMARRRARSLAYIRHHWLHWSPARWTHRHRRWAFWRTPHIVLLKRRLHYALFRRRLQRSWPHEEGISKREFYLIMHIHQLKQYLIECRGPHHYAPRGLVKRHGPAYTPLPAASTDAA